jgi:hypothetical protein
VFEPARAGDRIFRPLTRALNSFLSRFPRLAALARGYYSVALRARLDTRTQRLNVKPAQLAIRMVAAGERRASLRHPMLISIEPALLASDSIP